MSTIYVVLVTLDSPWILPGRRCSALPTVCWLGMLVWQDRSFPDLSHTWQCLLYFLVIFLNRERKNIWASLELKAIGTLWQWNDLLCRHPVCSNKESAFKFTWKLCPSSHVCIWISLFLCLKALIFQPAPRGCWSSSSLMPWKFKAIYL